MSGTTEPAKDAPSTNGEEPEHEEDVRARFRAALERKQAKAKSGESHSDGSSKIHDTHGPAASRRTFRRKSG
jgi:uncharacterized protein DUF5302